MRRILIIAGVVVAGLAIAYGPMLVRVWKQAHLFDEDQIHHNFLHIDELFPTRSVAAGGEVVEFQHGGYELPKSFLFRGEAYDTRAFLEDTATTGLLVMQDDEILFERYWQGQMENDRHIAWSVSKSVVSALFGIAMKEGHIRDIMQPVTDYLPELEGSGYDGVQIKYVLQMSSGVGFNEDYGDPNSDINRMGRDLATGTSVLEFAATLEREREPGTVQHYVSIDTQVLGEILVRATGQNLSEYMSQKLWRPVGMQADAYWMVDSSGVEMAFGGLNATLRDFARFGRLYLRGGSWNGVQVVPADWVKASVTPDAPHLMPGPKPSGNPMGYGYQWWLAPDSEGDFMALGVYDQMIYVDPKHRLVIAKHSANLDFQKNDFQATDESVALWRAIAADLESRPSPSVH